MLSAFCQLNGYYGRLWLDPDVLQQTLRYIFKGICLKSLTYSCRGQYLFSISTALAWKLSCRMTPFPLRTLALSLECWMWNGTGLLRILLELNADHSQDTFVFLVATNAWQVGMIQAHKCEVVNWQCLVFPSTIQVSLVTWCHWDICLIDCCNISAPVSDEECVYLNTFPPRASNVSHTVVLRPLKAGYFNFTSASVSYLAQEGGQVVVKTCFINYLVDDQ